jgi:glucose-6-phosphate isomerase
MLTKGVKFTNFKTKKKSLLIKKKLISLLKSKNEILNSLSQNYKDNFTKNIILKYKKNTNYRVIGMGGSSLGTQTIYDFLKYKIKKKFVFSDNLQVNLNKDKKK